MTKILVQSESKVSQNSSSRFIPSSTFRVGSPSSQISARSPPQFRSGSPSQQFRVGSPSSRHMTSSPIAKSPLACSPVSNYLPDTASNMLVWLVYFILKYFSYSKPSQTP